MIINPSTIKNVSLLSITSFANKFIAFVFSILAARTLGVELFGEYNLTWALVGIFGLLSDFGITNVALRDLAQKNKKTEDLFGSIAGLKIFFGIISYLIAVFLVNILSYPINIRIFVYICGSSIISNVFANLLLIIGSVNGRLKIPAIITVIYNIILTLLNSILLLKGYKLNILFINTLIINIFYIFIIYYIINKKFIKININLNIKVWKKIFINSLSFAALTLLGLIYFKLDIILLSKLKGDLDVGYYSSIYKFFEAWLIIPGAFTTALLPVLSRIYLTNLNKFKTEILKWAILMALLGISISLLMYFISYYIVIILLGSNYLPALPALRIIVWAIPLTFVNIVIYNAFYSMDLQSKVTRIFLITTIFNLVSNIILIPKYSFIGSAWTTIFSEMLNLSLALVVLIIVFRKKNVSQ